MEIVRASRLLLDLTHAFIIRKQIEFSKVQILQQSATIDEMKLDNQLSVMRAQVEEALGKDRVFSHPEFVVETAANLIHSFDDVIRPRSGPLATVREELLSIRDYTRPPAKVRICWRQRPATTTDFAL